MLTITPFKGENPDKPRFRAQRTVGKIAENIARQPPAVDQPPTTPTGIGLEKLLFNPKLTMNSKVKF